MGKWRKEPLEWWTVSTSVILSFNNFIIALTAGLLSGLKTCRLKDGLWTPTHINPFRHFTFLALNHKISRLASPPERVAHGEPSQTSSFTSIFSSLMSHLRSHRFLWLCILSFTERHFISHQRRPFIFLGFRLPQQFVCISKENWFRPTFLLLCSRWWRTDANRFFLVSRLTNHSTRIWLSSLRKFFAAS